MELRIKSFQSVKSWDDELLESVGIIVRPAINDLGVAFFKALLQRSAGLDFLGHRGKPFDPAVKFYGFFERCEFGRGAELVNACDFPVRALEAFRKVRIDLFETRDIGFDFFRAVALIRWCCTVRLVLSVSCIASRISRIPALNVLRDSFFCDITAP